MAKVKSNVELTRVNMNLPTSLVNDIKEYAMERGINTTNAYINLLQEIVEQKKMIKQLPESVALLQKLNLIDVTNLEQLNKIMSILERR